MGCLGVGEATRGEQLIANQGQEWNGYSHHKQKEQDLQVSKKKGWIIWKGQDKARTGSKGVGWQDIIIVVCICMPYMLSVNNSALCLG
jgi:hypothetical protein